MPGYGYEDIHASRMLTLVLSKSGFIVNKWILTSNNLNFIASGELSPSCKNTIIWLGCWTTQVWALLPRQ